MTIDDRQAFVFCDPSLGGYTAARPPFDPPNPVYAAVQGWLQRFGSDPQNPLGHLASPGDTVVVKPNWVKHEHPDGLTIDAVVTHPSVLRPIIDALLVALKGEGHIIVGDAPIQSCDFDSLCEKTGIHALMEHYARVARGMVSLADLRKERATMSRIGTVIERGDADGDPNGYHAVQFNDRSAFMPVTERSSRFRVAAYDPRRMAKHHSRGHHEYLISGSVLKADLVFLVPKMKTHRKAGMTAALKNSVGINGHKDWLPHHSRGSARSGGDEYLHPSILKSSSDSVAEWIDSAPGRNLKRALGLTSAVLFKMAQAVARDKFFEGSWHGNDTVWRMVLDLNRALLYADKNGVLQDTPQRKVCFLVDGILAGEWDGPICATPKPCGLLIGGTSAAVVDAVTASLMGFDYRKIHVVREAFRVRDLPLTAFGPEDIVVKSNLPDLDALDLLHPKKHFSFVPSDGWRGHIELDSRLAHRRAG